MLRVRSYSIDRPPPELVRAAVRNLLLRASPRAFGFQEHWPQQLGAAA